MARTANKQLLVNKSDQVINPATEDTLAEILLSSGGLYDTQIEENSGNADILYVGFATPGTATSAASWRIFELDLSNLFLGKRFADGDTNFDNIMDNAQSLSY